MPMPKLFTSVRDNDGRWHLAGERLEVLETVRRGGGDWDQRQLIKVRFEDGAHGAIFKQEIDE